MSLKNAFESHPMIIAIGAVSLFLNVAQAALGGYSSLFGERPIISESYFFVPLESSETIVDGEFNGNLVGLGCKVVHSEIRSIYTDVKVEKGMGPGPHVWGESFQRLSTDSATNPAKPLTAGSSMVSSWCLKTPEDL